MKPALARSAEAAALVYSLNIDEGGPLAELDTVAAWAGISPDELYRQMAELVDRGLAQVRGPWRAVLPHALAAKLARRGFARVRPNTLLESLQGKPRLFASLCKRIGLLHDIPEAATLAEQMFAGGAPLGNPAVLAGRDLEAFIEMAPAAPNAALDALDRSLRGADGARVLEREHSEYWRFARLIRSLAYEEAHFARAAALLVLMTAREHANENHNATRHEVEELFHIHLSGTMAPPSVRLASLDGFLNSTDSEIRRVGVIALDAMLEAGHFSSSAEFTFGARHRTFGWDPAEAADFTGWYGGAIDRVLALVEARDEIAEEALRKLAWSISSLGRSGMLDLVEAASARVRAVQFWTEGWRQLRQILTLEREGMADSVRARLEALELMLRPTSLEDRFTAYVGSENWIEYDPDDEPEEHARFERPAEIAQEIGAEIGAEHAAFERYAAWACVTQRGQLQAFGAGLYQSASDVVQRWDRLKAIFLASPEATRNPDPLLGYVYAAAQANVELANDWIDAVETEPAFVKFIVLLTSIVGVDARGLARMRRLVGVVPTWTYRNLMMGRAVENCPPVELAALLRALYQQGGDGQDGAFDVLAMRFFGEGQTHAPELIALARDILVDIPATVSSDTMRDHHMGNLAEACLHGGDEALARTICQRVHVMAGDRTADRHSWESVLKVVIRHHPRIVLDELLDKEPARETSRLESWLTSYQSGDDRSRDAPIDTIPPDLFMDWVREASLRRAPIAAELGVATSNAGERREWTRLAAGLLALPDGGVEAARALVHHFWPLHFSNLAALIQRRPLVAALADHPNAAVRTIAPELLTAIDGWIADGERRVRREDESFE